MRLKVTVRHGHVNDGVRSYVESKFAKLGRRLHDETLIEVVLDRERNPKIADDHLVEAELHVKGPNLHGREAAATYEAATDVLVDKLERQIERRRDKVVQEPRRRAQGASPEEPVPVEEIEQSLRARSTPDRGAAAARAGPALGRGRDPRPASPARMGRPPDGRRTRARRRGAVVRRARRREDDPRGRGRTIPGALAAAVALEPPFRAHASPASRSSLGGGREPDRGRRAERRPGRRARSSCAWNGVERHSPDRRHADARGHPGARAPRRLAALDVRRHRDAARRRPCGRWPWRRL